MKILFIALCLLSIAVVGTSLMFLSMSAVAKYKGNTPMVIVVVFFMLLMLIIGMLGPYFNPEFFNLK